jgi:hypothetical protein
MVAMVYRRRLRERPRERVLRIGAMVGTILVHIAFLVLLVFGPAYDLAPPPPPPPEENADALEVRLLDQPPPKPAVRGVAARAAPAPARPRRVASNQTAATTRSRRSQPPATVATPDAASVAVVPAAQVAAPPPSAKPRPKQPRKPPTAPPKQTDLPPVPKPEIAQPDFAVNAPVAAPIPPRFQPEPVRPPRPDGNQPLPPPPSLATPELPPAQPQVRPEPPTMTAATRVDVPTTTVAPVSVPRPEVAEASEPESAELAPVPDQAAAPAAPKIAATPRPTATVDIKPISVPQPAPVDTPELTAIDLSTDAAPRIAAPTAKLEHAAVQTSIGKPEPVRPQADATDIATPAPAVGNEPAATNAPVEQPALTGTGDRSAALEATPTPGVAGGNETATPEGASASAPGVAKAPGSAEGNAPGSKTGSITGNPLASGTGENTGKPGSQPGQIGQYIQLRPHGDTAIMSHDTNPIKYKPTRFADDWTPEGESSIDTALRHAVEKTTIKHTFNLPRGVRIECHVMPLLPMALLGCSSGDPPPKAVDEKFYQTMKLAPANPLLPGLGTPAASSSTANASLPLDNDSLCATAKVAGGPPPPGCAVPVGPRPLPKAGDSWVPASDQFH